jgi:uncharacterized protein DUF1844
MSDETRGDTFVMKDQEKAIDFSTFLVGLASSALIHLGEAPNPETGSQAKDLALARQTLDLLSLLREKTRGNLSTEEERLFEGLLTDLRLRYVDAQKS